jgi:uncharacterized protein
MISIQDTSDGATFVVKVHPRGKRNAITGAMGDAVKISLTAPPLDGRANQACIEFVSDFLKVARSSVTIASGESSRRKVVRVAGLSAAELRMRLHL